MAGFLEPRAGRFEPVGARHDRDEDRARPEETADRELDVETPGVGPLRVRDVGERPGDREGEQVEADHQDNSGERSRRKPAPAHRAIPPRWRRCHRRTHSALRALNQQRNAGAKEF